MATQSGKLVVIVGQTASGKSALAMEIALKFDGEIICADSRTIYKGMNIGTAKPSAEDRKLVKHHMLDVVNPDERFTTVDFKRVSIEIIEDIVARDKLPIMVGGTGLYIDSVLYDYSFDGSAERDPQNPRHALPGSGNKKDQRDNTLVIGLELDNEALRERITRRVELMVEEDFPEEVNQLVDKYGDDISAFNAPGYRPFIEHLSGRLNLEEAKAKFVQNDMNLAKRQKTWFKRNKSIQWVKSSPEALNIVVNFLGQS